jgi:hypothetical protein
LKTAAEIKTPMGHFVLLVNTADEFQRATVALRSTKEIAKRCDIKYQ